MTQIPTFEEIAEAHGHRCPGIAIGYKMAKAAAEWAGDEPVRVYSTTTRCPLDALRHTFRLTDETLTIEDKGELHFVLEKADGSKLFIDEVPGSKIKNAEGARDRRERGDAKGSLRVGCKRRLFLARILLTIPRLFAIIVADRADGRAPCEASVAFSRTTPPPKGDKNG